MPWKRYLSTGFVIAFILSWALWPVLVDNEKIVVTMEDPCPCPCVAPKR